MVLRSLQIPPAFGRAVGCAVFSVMILWQLYQLSTMNWTWLSLLRWLLVSILFVQFLWAYVGRREAVDPARGWKEVCFPLLCAAWPFGVIMLPEMLYKRFWLWDSSFAEAYLWPLWSSPWTREGYWWGLLLMALGEVVTVWGMTRLKNNFSIMTEVRSWVNDGIYAWIRHPLYSGEIVSMVGFALFWPSMWTLGGALGFALLQVLRAKNEEGKLSKTFLNYPSYIKKTGMFFPKWRRK